MESKVRNLLSLWKQNFVINKVYAINNISSNEIACVVDKLNINPLYLILLGKILKQKGISLSEITPLSVNKISLTFKPYKE